MNHHYSDIEFFLSRQVARGKGMHAFSLRFGFGRDFERGTNILAQLNNDQRWDNNPKP